MIKSKSAPPTYFVVYGFGESHVIGRYFRAEMDRHGFKFAATYAEADIIVAHSGGCLALPPSRRQTVFLFQPAAAWLTNPWHIWYAKTLLEIRGHYRTGLLHRYAMKVSLNVYNLVRHPRQTRRFVKLARRYQFSLPDVQAGRLVTIINKDDPWSNRITVKATAQGTAAGTYVGMPGTHDELWTNPGAYVALIRRLFHEA